MMNTIALSGICLVVLYGIYNYYKSRAQIPEKPKFLWGEQVGRTRPIQSKNGDASMATELTRRRTIQMVGKQKTIKETKLSSGTGTGVYEIMMTSICPLFCPCPPVISVILDGGGADDEYCPMDGNPDTNVYYDGGGIDTLVCGI